MRLLLVNGIRASGKSEFGKWLAQHHRFRHEHLEKGKHMAWLQRKTPKAFIDEIRGGRPDQILDRGFPPHVLGLKTVRGLVWPTPSTAGTNHWLIGARGRAKIGRRPQWTRPANADARDSPSVTCSTRPCGCCFAPGSADALTP